MNATTTPAPDAPILEAEHVRKHFPVRQYRPFAKPLAVHAVEDISLALSPVARWRWWAKAAAARRRWPDCSPSSTSQPQV